MEKKWEEQRIEIKNLKSFKNWTYEWVQKINYPHLVLLNGPMGSGKTKWVRFLVEALEAQMIQKKKEIVHKNQTKGKKGKKTITQKEENKIEKKKGVSSPSFSFHNQYSVAKEVVIDHIDFYRIKNEEDLESTGFWDVFEAFKGIMVIEWAHRFPLSESLFQGEVTQIEIRPLTPLMGDKKGFKKKSFPLSDLEIELMKEADFFNTGDERRELRIKSLSR